ncbi:MAG: copper resistance protein CopC [Neobacillus sp.]
MKKLTFILICMLILIPTLVSAHTELTSSNPESGQVVTEDLQEIVLTFGGKIEPLSKLTLQKEGVEILLAGIEPIDNQMTGTLSEPLENGEYVIIWNIVGEDGHIIEGEIPFSVQKQEVVEQTPETSEPTVNEEPVKEESNKIEKNESLFDWKIVFIPAVIMVIFAIGIILVLRKNKK